MQLNALVLTTNCRYLYFFFLTYFLYSCAKKDTKVVTLEVFDGPTMQMRNVLTLFSDSAKIKVRLTAPLQNEMQNGDRHFPEGMLIYFFNSKGDTSTSMKANKGQFIKSSSIYTGTGDVVITDLEEGKTMNTELLNWNPSTKKVYTDKFVRIQTVNEILTGNGLDADQDFKYYKIRNPAGVFSIQK